MQTYIRFSTYNPENILPRTFVETEIASQELTSFLSVSIHWKSVLYVEQKSAPGHLSFIDLSVFIQKPHFYIIDLKNTYRAILLPPSFLKASLSKKSYSQL